MTKQDTTPKQSSGGGYQFENEAIAYVQVYLLARATPFELPGSIIEQIDTQRPATEWHLDDLLVTTRTQSRRHRLAFSIKSNRQITRGGLPDDFVRNAWQQLLHDISDVFDEGRDYLGLMTAPVGADLKTAIYDLLRLGRDQDASDLARQVHLQHRANKALRALHDSARCPEDLATKHEVDRDTSAGRLLRRLLWIPIDFEDDGSIHRAQALSLCQQLLRSGSVDDARTLWGTLKEIAGRLRRSGGSTDLPKLVDELRGRFGLRDFPDYAAAWDKIDEDTRSAISRVRSTIGGKVSLPRVFDHEVVSKALAEQRTAVLLGASGTGKSALAKSQSMGAMQRGKTLWLDAERLEVRTLAEWRSHLGIANPLGEVIRVAPITEALLVLDGLDRLYNEAGFATAAELVHATRIGDFASPWRLLITCTPEEWSRVRESLSSHSVVIPPGSVVSIGFPDPTELEALWAAFPHLAVLSFRLHLAPVLFRPKILDLLATHATAENNLALIGESGLARLFWDRMIAREPQALARAEAARRIAETFADDLRPDISMSALASAVNSIDSIALAELIRSHILIRVDGRISFDHDLYADWIRVRQLRDVTEGGHLTDYLSSRLESPVWHRALRLYGVDLLEQANNITPWNRAFEAVGSIPGSSGKLAQDILLEATAFTSAPAAGLLRADLWPLLARNDGLLLVRLLNRLFHTATIANAAVVAAVTKEDPDLAIHVAAGSRLPYWPYWFGILTFLHVHRDEIPLPARRLVARAADLWLRSTSTAWPLRKQAAVLAVTLGDALLNEKEERDALFHDSEDDQQVYRAVLAAGHEEPERVTQIVLEAAGRRARRFEPPPLTEKEREELASLHESTSALSLGIYGPLPEPWPNGPVFRVDGALQNAVLETEALLPLTEALPDIACETLLALVIAVPQQRGFLLYDSYHVDYGLAWTNWHPPFYTRGPFRSFLAKSEGQAISAIVGLVEHATDRWVEARARYLAQQRHCSVSEIEPPMVAIEVQGCLKEYIGDNRVFNWSVYCESELGIVGSALSAFEKYLYDRADSGGDLTALIQRLLAESRSLAIVGMLGVFARRHPKYFWGPLRGLLGSPHALEWTLMGSVSGGWEITLTYGSLLLPSQLHGEYRAWHEMQHRKVALREWAMLLLLNESEFESYFKEVRARLKAGLDPGGPYVEWEFVEDLVAQLDPENYAKYEDAEGDLRFYYTPPEYLLGKHAANEEPIAREMLLTMLPVQCLQLIKSDEFVREGLLDQLWEKAKYIEELGSYAGNNIIASPANALAGVAAVIILRGGTWREAHLEAAEWARKVILVAAREDRTETLYVPTMEWHRLAFAAQSLPLIWTERSEDTEVRTAVASLALYGPSDVVGALSIGVLGMRAGLPDDHKRLLRALLLRAGLMPRMRSAEHRFSWGSAEEEGAGPDHDATSFTGELASIEQALVESNLSTTVPDLDEVAPLSLSSERWLLRRGQRRQIPRRPLDDALVIAAFRGIPNPNAGEEDPWFSIWERAIHQTLSPFAQLNEESASDIDERPEGWSRYLMDRIADVIASLNSQRAARRLWQPIIELGVSAGDMVSCFAKSWIAYSLFPDATEHVVRAWMSMIDAALASPRWAAGPRRADTIWSALLGFDSSADIWIKELHPRARNLKPQLGAWAGKHLTGSDNVRRLARFLVLPATVDLVLPGLIWLHTAALEIDERYFWGWPDSRGYADDSVTALLVLVWTKFREELHQDAAALRAFRNLLKRLVSRQYAPAMELAERVGAMGTGTA